MAKEISHGKIHSDFADALARLIDGKPHNRELAQKAKEGKLRINISSVARESGRSRTLIALEKTKYPEVRRAILAVSGKCPRDNSTTKSAGYREKIKKLERQNRLLASHVAALTEHRDRLLDELRNASVRSRKVTPIR